MRSLFLTRHGLVALSALVLALPAMSGCSGSTGDDTDDDDASQIETGDDDATAGDDDTTAGDDDATGGDDDATHLGDDDVSIPPNVLEEGEWYAANQEMLVDFADDNGGTGSSKDLPAAVFEFEDTSIFNAIGPALFRYQVLNLAFEVTPDQLAGIVPTAAGEDYYSPATITKVSSPAGDISLEGLQHDIVLDFDYLYGSYAGLGCEDRCTDLEALKETTQYRDFVAKMLFLYEALTADPSVGPDFTGPMITTMLGGYTEQQARDLASAAYIEQLSLPIEVKTVTGPPPTSSYAVPYALSASYLQGIRAMPEMLDLYDYLRRAGFDVWIVTTAAQVAVQGVSGTTSGFDVPPDHVIGIQLEPGHPVPGQKNPPMSTSLKTGVPLPYGDGKVQSIQQLIQKEPLLTAGSAVADYEMLTGYPKALNLVINRNLSCPMSGLYQKAKLPGGTDTNHYLLQGWDENAGQFVQDQASIPLGETSPAPLPDSSGCGG
jgi:hypothetical protein